MNRNCLIDRQARGAVASGNAKRAVVMAARRATGRLAGEVDGVGSTLARADHRDQQRVLRLRLRDQRPQGVERHREYGNQGGRMFYEKIVLQRYLQRRLPADQSTGLLQSCSLILRSGSSGGAMRGSCMVRNAPP